MAQTLLVSSSGNEQVLAYDIARRDVSRRVRRAEGSGGLVAPFGLTFGPNGNLFVTSGSNEVLEYDGQDGSFVQVFVDAAANGGLDQPRGLTYKGDGNLLVASFGTDEILEFEGQTGVPAGQVGPSRDRHRTDADQSVGDPGRAERQRLCGQDGCGLWQRRGTAHDHDHDDHDPRRDRRRRSAPE